MNYDNSAATALRLLTSFGRDITLRTVTTGAYDTETGSNTVTTTDATVKAVDFAVKGESYVDGQLIKMSDRYALVSYDGAISVSDKLVIGSVVWSIVAVKTLAPAGIVVLHKVYIRK